MKHSVPAQTENDLIDFYRNAIRTRSYLSCTEIS